MSSNIFEGKKVYPEPWIEGYSRPFNDCEIKMVESCKVIGGRYSLLLECILHNGKKSIIPLTKDSDAYIGLIPNFTQMKLVELERGDERCIKICIKL